MWLVSGFLNSQVTRLLLVRKQVPVPLSLTLVVLPVLGLVVRRLISTNPELNVKWVSLFLIFKSIFLFFLEHPVIKL